MLALVSSTLFWSKIPICVSLSWLSSKLGTTVVDWTQDSSRLLLSNCTWTYKFQEVGMQIGWPLLPEVDLLRLCSVLNRPLQYIAANLIDFEMVRLAARKCIYTRPRSCTVESCHGGMCKSFKHLFNLQIYHAMPKGKKGTACLIFKPMCRDFHQWAHLPQGIQSLAHLGTKY